ncbi:hypothetical protein Scep_017219 [Stephania cephalantha]|uniref:Uncharacterized protein n=1 Tax=Stephania cephalantha TaxID=152367 RepID=A0AAP0NWP6_9MAGN
MALEDKFLKMATELATMESMFESLDIITRREGAMRTTTSIFKAVHAIHVHGFG